MLQQRIYQLEQKTCRTLGDTYTESVLSRNDFPKFSQLSALNKFVSANHTLRKQLFLQIVAVARSGDNFISNGMREVVHMMRSHEMQHLNMIDEFILLKYPKFLKLSRLRDLKARFRSAISFITTYPPEEVLYLKLLYTKDGTAVLNRKHFHDTVIYYLLS